eukprot:6334149-Pyramimonas_sp.AAC.1
MGAGGRCVRGSRCQIKMACAWAPRPRFRFSPVVRLNPQTSSITMLIQVLMNLSLLADIADVESAFCHSDLLARARGRM